MNVQSIIDDVKIILKYDDDEKIYVRYNKQLNELIYTLTDVLHSNYVYKIDDKKENSSVEKIFPNYKDMLPFTNDLGNIKLPHDKFILDYINETNKKEIMVIKQETDKVFSIQSILEDKDRKKPLYVVPLIVYYTLDLNIEEINFIILNPDYLSYFKRVPNINNFMYNFTIDYLYDYEYDQARETFIRLCSYEYTTVNSYLFNHYKID